MAKVGTIYFKRKGMEKTEEIETLFGARLVTYQYALQKFDTAKTIFKIFISFLTAI